MTPRAQRPDPGRRSPGPRRVQILWKAGLGAAPAEVQRDFWRRYNGRARRGPSPLAEALIDCAERLAELRRLAPLREAWAAVVPAALARQCEVLDFRAGRLSVRVDGPTTRFIMERELGSVLLRALHSHPAARNVREIVYRIGPADGAGAAADTPRRHRTGSALE